MRYLSTVLLLTVVSWPAAADTSYRSEACQKRQTHQVPAEAVMVLRAGACEVQVPTEIAVQPVQGIQVLRGKQLSIVDPR